MQGISKLAILAASTALLASPSFAEEEPTFLGKITISALRTAYDTLKAGVSVSVLTEEDLAKDRSAKLADVLARLPGVSFSQEGSIGGTGVVRVRGLDGRYLAVLVDGVRVNDHTGVVSSFDFGGMLTSDIGRVEVLRGSQSALWGGSAVGGVINIQTREALEEGSHQIVGVEAGSYGTARLSWGHTYKDDRYESALTVTRFHTDGFSASDAGDEADGADITRLSYSTKYQVSDELALGGSFFVHHGDYDYDPSAASDAAGYTIGRQEYGARVFAELETGNTLHSFELTTYTINRDYTEPGDYSTYDGNRLGFAWQAVTTVSDSLSTVYGVDWSRELAEYSNLPSGSTSTSVYGVFGQVLWSPSDSFDLSATLRVDKDSDFGTFPTGRLAMSWAAAENTYLRASIGRGYRAPSIDERYGFYPSPWGDFIGNPDLQPEESWSYELGIEHQLANGGLLSASVFRIEIDNLVTYAFDPVLSTLENVAGAAVSQGVEIAADLPINDQISFVLSYAYTDARTAAGTKRARVPLHLLTLSLNADVTDRLSLGLSAVHSAGVMDNHPVTFALTDVPSYTVLNAQASYSLTETIDAYLRIDNLTDEDYRTSLGYNASERAAYLGVQAKF